MPGIVGKRTNPDISKMRKKRKMVKPRNIPRAPFAMGDEIKALSLNQASGGGVLSSYNFLNTGEFQLLNGIQAGSGFSQRVGRKIRMKSLKVQFNINPFPSRTQVGDLGRVLIVYDRQTNGALPALADVLQDTNTAAANTTNVAVGPNLSNRERFTVLRDYSFTLPAVVVAATGVPSSAYPDSFEGEHQSFIKWYIKLKGLETVFNADTGDVGSIATGSIFVLALGGVAAGTNAWLVNSWHSRLRYYD